MKKLILVLAVSFFSGSLFAGGDCGASGVSMLDKTVAIDGGADNPIKGAQ